MNYTIIICNCRDISGTCASSAKILFGDLNLGFCLKPYDLVVWENSFNNSNIYYYIKFIIISSWYYIFSHTNIHSSNLDVSRSPLDMLFKFFYKFATWFVPYWSSPSCQFYKWIQRDIGIKCKGKVHKEN